jgi:glycerophosphoryl diester phosphodiesterase
MKLSEPVQKSLMRCTDFYYKIKPQPSPRKDRLRACKIIAHRGEHDNKTIFENTLEAFDLALKRGIWGIEFDLRWTRDLWPVVNHDPDLKRIFRQDIKISDVTLAELQSRCPAVPSLADVIQIYGKKLHLMVEVKSENYPNPQRQNQILGECFSSLESQTDYHLMSLTPEMLDLITFIPASSFIAIATTNMSRLSELALNKKFQGVAGHYLLMTNTTMAKHRQMGQKVGTGYPRSRKCLFREINRGVEWIFSNNAGELQTIVDELCRQETP